MFTGLIEEIGTVSRLEKVGGGIRLTVHGPKSASELSTDDSVAINGCCLTVISKSQNSFTVEAVEETLMKTTLGNLRQDAPVNLELAMKMNERLGGHLVLGHVDGVGVVKSIERKETSWLFTIQVPRQFLHYVIPVGSISIDGVSLTIARLEMDELTVSLIPHTFENTTFQFLRIGMSVNLEFDLIGKYIERLMMKDSLGEMKNEITHEKLRAWGYGS
jgi:riboflavin synthase